MYKRQRLTDQEFKDLRLKHKDMTTKQFAKFLEGEGKTTYLGDKWNASSVSRLQSKLDIGVGTTGPLTIRTVDEAKKIIRQHPGAKFFFLGNPTDSEITQYASDLVSREKLSGKGGKKGFPIGGTKEGKMFRNFYDSSLKADGRMELLTDVPTDADGNIDWKMKDKNGVHVWKKAKFYDNKTGATYTWGKNYKPGDLRKQVDAAYGDGFFAKSVKTYDDQAKMNKMKFKGRSLNEWMREGLLKKELEIKLDRPLTNSKADKKLLKEFYALRKPSFSFTEAHHVEGVGKNPFRMEVSYRAANREQNNLLNKYKAGNLTKTEYAKAMENLSDTKGGIRYKTDGRFIGQTGTPERIIATSAKDAGLLKNKDFPFYDTSHSNKTFNSMSLINLNSIKDFEKKINEKIQIQRFRANFYVDGIEAWEERNWVGKIIKINNVSFKVEKNIPRCVAINLKPKTDDNSLNLLKSLKKTYNHFDMGIYLNALEDGKINIGDKIQLSQ